MDYKQESKKFKLKLHTEIKALLDREPRPSYNEMAKEVNTTPQHIGYIIKTQFPQYLSKNLDMRGGEN